MSNQNADLKQKLKTFVFAVAEKKGSQWALETQAEFQASERYIAGNPGKGNVKMQNAELGRLSGWELSPEAVFSAEETFVPHGGKRITPHDTGNLIESISVQETKKSKEILFSVGVDYNKLNRPRVLYSWLFERHGKPGVYVQRPGKKTSGNYVKAANRNSDEMPNFLETWRERGESNVKRIFR